MTKRDIRKKASVDPVVRSLYQRITDLQDDIVELFERPEVERIEYYQTDDGNEPSIDAYEQVDWPLNRFADMFFESMKSLCLYGFIPTIKIVFQKER